MSRFRAPIGTLITQANDEKRLYIHLIDYPFAELVMENIAGKIKYMQFLHDGSELRYRENSDGSVNLIVPELRPNCVVPVIEVILNSKY